MAARHGFRDPARHRPNDVRRQQIIQLGPSEKHQRVRIAQEPFRAAGRQDPTLLFSRSTPHMSKLTRPFSLARRVFLLQANEFSPFVAVCFLFAVYSALNIFTGTIIELSKVVYISRFSPTSRSLPPSLSFPLSLPCPFPFCLLPASSFSSASPPISLYR